MLSAQIYKQFLASLSCEMSERKQMAASPGKWQFRATVQNSGLHCSTPWDSIHLHFFHLMLIAAPSDGNDS